MNLKNSAQHIDMWDKDLKCLRSVPYDKLIEKMGLEFFVAREDLPSLLRAIAETLKVKNEVVY